MRALKISNGDLVLGAQGYAEVTGVTKVAQDLTIAVLTPYGSNRFHPGWGSVLDSKIGSTQGEMTKALVRAEVQRVVTSYINLQTAQLQTAQLNGYVSPYSNDDIATGITDLTVTAAYTAVYVHCAVTTAANSNTALIASISPSGVSGSFT